MVLGVPDSAGAYCVGVERAPAALRHAGLLDALTAAGADVHDAGDLTTRVWRPDRERPRVQNLDVEVDALVELADASSTLLEPGSRLLVLGGSCMVAVGVCGGFVRHGLSPKLIYIDRHLDLNTPHSTVEGSLSWMGMAHALRVPDAEPALTDAVGTAPILRPSDLVYLGVGDTEVTSWEREQVARLQIPVVPQTELVADPAAAARRARAFLTPGPFVVHVDVDVLDFLDAPLAENVNGRNSGPTIAELGRALTLLVHDDDCLAVSVGQLDPNHAEADDTAIPRLVDELVASLTGRSSS